MIELTINDKKGKFPEGKTLLECIESTGIKVPTLCSHKALAPYGACRLCLVEISQNGGTTIQASCTYPAINNLKVNIVERRKAKSICSKMIKLCEEFNTKAIVKSNKIEIKVS